MNDSALNQVAARLYLLPPELFIQAREERANQVADPQLAERVHKLTKPTIAAWALNNLAAKHRDELVKALKLGVQLAQAQEQLDGAALMRLSDQRRQAIRALTDSAQQLASQYGHPLNSAAVQQIRMTLNAALSDSELAEELRSGTLASPVEQSGFGPLSTERTAKYDYQARSRKKNPTGQRSTSRQQEITRAREKVNEATAHLTAVKSAIREKEKAHRQIDQKHDALQVQLDKLANQEHKITAQLNQLRDKADRADNALTQARQKLTDMRKSPRS